MSFNSNQYNNPVPANLPGYILTRAQVAYRRDADPRWFDTVGKLIILDAETCIVVPAGEMKYCDDRAKMPGHQLTRLVVSQDGGIFLGFTGQVPNPWIRTLSKISFPIDADTRNDQHFMKAFGLVDDGPVMGYHVFRTGSGLRQQEIDSVNGHPIADIDFVAVKGQVHLVATTLPTLAMPKRQCFTVKASYEDLLQKKPFQLDWNNTPWTEGYNVTGLRGTIKNEEVTYTFLDQDTGTLYNARYNDKTPKVLEKGVKGILITVTGAKVADGHDTTVVTDDKIIALGTGTDKFRQTIADFNKNPALYDMSRNLRQARMINGILGDREIFFRNPETPLAHTMVATRETQVNN
jgi:hypothetical protein